MANKNNILMYTFYVTSTSTMLASDNGITGIISGSVDKGASWQDTEYNLSDPTDEKQFRDLVYKFRITFAWENDWFRV